MNHPNRSEKRLIKWNFPNAGPIKLNTDGSCLGCPGYASFGGLARNDQGRWIEGFCGRIEMASVLKAKLTGIRYTLKLCRDKGWTNVDIETDSVVAEELVNGVGDLCNHPEKIIIEDCREMMADSSFTLRHIYKEMNRCADTLARFGGIQSENAVRIFVPPIEVMEDKKADQKGTMFKRGS